MKMDCILLIEHINSNNAAWKQNPGIVFRNFRKAANAISLITSLNNTFKIYQWKPRNPNHKIY